MIHRNVRIRLIPLRRESPRSATRRAARRRSRRLGGLLEDLKKRRERLLISYERLLARSFRVQAQLKSVTCRLAAADRAVLALEGRQHGAS